jgi:hypothetical protein
MRKRIAVETPKAFAIMAGACATQSSGTLRRSAIVTRSGDQSPTTSQRLPAFADSGTQGLGRGVGRALGVGIVRGVGVGRGVGLTVGVALGVALGVTVGVTVGVGVTEGVTVGVGVGVGTCPPGNTRT